MSTVIAIARFAAIIVAGLLFASLPFVRYRFGASHHVGHAHGDDHVAESGAAPPLRTAHGNDTPIRPSGR